jgi:hypothetical protein
MLIQWKREQVQATLADHPDPSQDPVLTREYLANEGLAYDGVLLLARRIGLRSIPPMSLTLWAMEGLLHQYGPLWTHGAEHIVVIVGVDACRDRIFIHDPWPVNKGAKGWHSYSNWFIRGRHSARRATDPEVQASFLYHP